MPAPPRDGALLLQELGTGCGQSEWLSPRASDLGGSAKLVVISSLFNEELKGNISCPPGTLAI